MSGVGVIVTRLKAYSALTDIVPATQIMAGEVPLNTALPNIGVTRISNVPRNIVAMPGTNIMNTERVQVTVVVAGLPTQAPGTGYPGLSTILGHVLKACGNQHGTIAGVTVDSILPDTEGPDFFPQDPSLAVSSRDFIVKWFTP